jgi:ABC-type multidrug transport system fused ATPase/permease subunit
MIIKGFSAAISAGQKVAIVGPMVLEKLQW